MTEDDQALSRLAAKAIGLEIGEFQELISSMPDDYIDGGFMVGEVHPSFGFRGYYWNPLDHDGDALRLAVKLRFDIEYEGQVAWVNYSEGGITYAVDESLIGDEVSAVRRAIVRAAAELGQYS